MIFLPFPVLAEYHFCPVFYVSFTLTVFAQYFTIFQFPPNSHQGFWWEFGWELGELWR